MIKSFTFTYTQIRLYAFYDYLLLYYSYFLHFFILELSLFQFGRMSKDE